MAIWHSRLAAAAVCAAVMGSGAAWAEPQRWQLNMTPGVTDMSQQVYDLHMLILWICVGIGVIVFGAMFYSIWAHRKSRGAQPAQFSHNTTAEVIWTVIPVLILVAMAVPATRVLIEMTDTSDAEMTVKITGYQWMWRYEYVNYGDDEDLGINFISRLDADSNAARQRGSGIDPRSVDSYLLEVDRRLVLPTDTKIRFVLTANDVIHSWWVPALGWKQDAIPGFINEQWTYINEPGIYRGQCAELCGKDHGFMPVVIEAVPRPEFEAWLASQRQQVAIDAEEALREWTHEELMARGEAVYAQQCAACHQPDGRGLAPAFPAIAGNPVTVGPLDAHLDVILNGRPGTAMQAFRSTLTPQDIAAAVTYTRNAFGNSAGDYVQPVQVAEAKRG